MAITRLILGPYTVSLLGPVSAMNLHQKSRPRESRASRSSIVPVVTGGGILWVAACLMMSAYVDHAIFPAATMPD
jgi:hypothetical protein